jgi:hypothetical protein
MDRPPGAPPPAPLPEEAPEAAQPPRRATSAAPPPTALSALSGTFSAPSAPAAAIPASAAAAAAAPSLMSSVTAAMPPALREQLMDLETWAQGNRRDAKWDAVKFWALKIPAIVVSAGSGVFAYFKPAVAVVGGALASLCVLIDALNPGGALRNAHLQAFNELRILQERMKSQWQVGFLRHEDRELLAAKIIEGASKEKERINAAITIAETSLAVTTRRGKH